MLAIRSAPPVPTHDFKKKLLEVSSYAWSPERPDGYSLLCVSENKLAVELFLDKLARCCALGFPDAVAGYADYTGLPRFRQSIAGLMNRTLPSSPPVAADDVIVGTGAHALVEHVIHSVCNPGDGVLIPAPYYPGFDFDLLQRNACHPIAVHPIHTSTSRQQSVSLAAATNTSDRSCTNKPQRTSHQPSAHQHNQRGHPEGSSSPQSDPGNIGAPSTLQGASKKGTSSDQRDQMDGGGPFSKSWRDYDEGSAFYEVPHNEQHQDPGTDPQDKEGSSAFWLPGVDAFQAAFDAATATGVRPAALLFSNPANPLGITYPPPLLQSILVWAIGKGIHVISDELYYNSYFGHIDSLDPGLGDGEGGAAQSHRSGDRHLGVLRLGATQAGCSGDGSLSSPGESPEQGTPWERCKQCGAGSSPPPSTPACMNGRPTTPTCVPERGGAGTSTTSTTASGAPQAAGNVSQTVEGSGARTTSAALESLPSTRARVPEVRLESCGCAGRSTASDTLPAGTSTALDAPLDPQAARDASPSPPLSPGGASPAPPRSPGSAAQAPPLSPFVSAREAAAAAISQGLLEPTDVDMYLHTVYGLSKDFGASGLRVGWLVTRSQPLATAIRPLSMFTCVSQPMQHALALMLEDVAWVDGYLEVSRQALLASYGMVRRALTDARVPFVAATSGLFVWLDLSAWLPGHPGQGLDPVRPAAPGEGACSIRNTSAAVGPRELEAVTGSVAGCTTETRSTGAAFTGFMGEAGGEVKPGAPREGASGENGAIAQDVAEDKPGPIDKGSEEDYEGKAEGTLADRLGTLHTPRGLVDPREMLLWHQLANDYRVLLTPGTDCHSRVPGWYRLCYASAPPDALAVGLARLTAFVADRLAALCD
eukprot:jgi/Mesvir1/27362/Mv07172-RA.1